MSDWTNRTATPRRWCSASNGDLDGDEYEWLPDVTRAAPGPAVPLGVTVWTHSVEPRRS